MSQTSTAMTGSEILDGIRAGEKRKGCARACVPARFMARRRLSGMTRFSGARKRPPAQ